MGLGVNTAEYAKCKNNDILIKNGRFIDVVNGRCFDQSVSLLVRNGKIQAMPGLPGEPDGKAAAYVVDLRGKTVMPGLFNTHCHLQFLAASKKSVVTRQVERSMSDCLEYGITNIRDAWASNLGRNRAFVDRIKKGEIQGPRVYQSVAVSPEGGYCAPEPNLLIRAAIPYVDYKSPLSGCVTFRRDASDQEVRDAVNRAIDERGAEYIKFADQSESFLTNRPGAAVMTDRQLEAAANQARLRGIPSTIHHTKASLFRRSVKAGVTSLAHLPQDVLLTDKDIETFFASGCFIEPTLSVSFGLCWGCLDSRAAEDPYVKKLEKFRETVVEELLESYWLPELASASRRQYKKYMKGNFRLMGVFDLSAPMIRRTRALHAITGNIRLIYGSGSRSRIACGNDATVAPYYTQASIKLEFDMLRICLERSRDYKTDAADLLRMATIQSAQALKLDDSFGSIEKGKTADLVVLDGNPLEDHRLIGSRAAAVFMDGCLVVNNCGLEYRSARAC